MRSPNGTGIMKYEMQNRREYMKNLKDYLKMIVTAVTCFLMGFVKREKEYDWKLGNVWRNTGNNVVWDNPKAKMISAYIVKDNESKKKEFGAVRERRKTSRKNKIISWNEPRIQNKLSRSVYFNTG